MKIGLIGLDQTGKTTLFNLLTGKDDSAAPPGGKGAANIGTGSVPDGRIDFLSALYKPKKTTYAKIELIDIAGFSVSGDNRNSGAAKFLNDVRPCDALIHVLRVFNSGSITHDSGNIDPARDLGIVETEMLLADFEMIDKRIDRIKTGKKITKEHEAELELLTRCFDQLDKGGTLKDMELTSEERTATKSFSFLTEKPRLAVVNLDENQWEAKDYPNKEALNTLCKKLSIPLIELCVEMELEISRLDEEDKKIFMDDLGIDQPGISVLARAVYEHMNLISFMTIGGDEVRAWTIDKGIDVRTAAGKIHTDFYRGFIRAEVVKYENLFEHGSMTKLKEKGLFRLEGKEYIVIDGDIINIRFNV